MSASTSAFGGKQFDVGDVDADEGDDFVAREGGGMGSVFQFPPIKERREEASGITLSLHPSRPEKAHSAGMAMWDLLVVILTLKAQLCTSFRIEFSHLHAE